MNERRERHSFIIVSSFLLMYSVPPISLYQFNSDHRLHHHPLHSSSPVAFNSIRDARISNTVHAIEDINDEPFEQSNGHSTNNVVVVKKFDESGSSKLNEAPSTTANVGTNRPVVQSVYNYLKSGSQCAVNIPCGWALYERNNPTELIIDYSRLEFRKNNLCECAPQQACIFKEINLRNQWYVFRCRKSDGSEQDIRNTFPRGRSKNIDALKRILQTSSSPVKHRSSSLNNNIRQLNYDPESSRPN